jgi:hypothetical protein
MSNASAVIPRVPRFPDPEPAELRPPPRPSPACGGEGRALADQLAQSAHERSDQLAQSAHEQSDEIARMAVALTLYGVDLDRVAVDAYSAVVALRSAGFAAGDIVRYLDRATAAAGIWRDEIATARRKHAAKGEYPC